MSKLLGCTMNETMKKRVEVEQQKAKRCPCCGKPLKAYADFLNGIWHLFFNCYEQDDCGWDWVDISDDLYMSILDRDGSYLISEDMKIDLVALGFEIL